MAAAAAAGIDGVDIAGLPDVLTQRVFEAAAEAGIGVGVWVSAGLASRYALQLDKAESCALFARRGAVVRAEPYFLGPFVAWLPSHNCDGVAVSFSRPTCPTPCGTGGTKRRSARFSADLPGKNGVCFRLFKISKTPVTFIGYVSTLQIQTLFTLLL